MSWKPKVLALVASHPVTWGTCPASSDWPSPLDRIIGRVVIDTHHPTNPLNPKIGTKGPVVVFRIFPSGRTWNAIRKTGEKKKKLR